MSDTTIRPWLAPTTGRASLPFYLRAVVRGAGRTARPVVAFVEAYNLIEATCLLSAAAFGLGFIALAFGLSL